MVAFPPLIRAMMRRDWRGQEHLPGGNGVIVASNHLSYVDWAAMALFVHQSGRYPAFLIKSSMFEVKGLGAFLHACGQFPVRRGAADAALVIRDAERGLARGECVVIYPEGTATRDPALWPMVARTGAARLALATGVPVIPVAVWGSQDILPYGSTKPHLVPRHTVHMLAGPPVDLSAHAGQPLNRGVLRAATNDIMADIGGLLAQLRGGTPPAEPYDPAAARRAARAARAAGDGEPNRDTEPNGNSEPNGAGRRTGGAVDGGPAGGQPA